MKKGVIFVFFVTSILTACGAKTTGPPSQTAVKAEVQSAESVVPTAQNQEKQSAGTKNLVEVEEQEIFNQDGVKVTVKGFDQDSKGPYLNVLIERILLSKQETPV